VKGEIFCEEFSLLFSVLFLLVNKILSFLSHFNSWFLTMVMCCWYINVKNMHEFYPFYHTFGLCIIFLTQFYFLFSYNKFSNVPSTFFRILPPSGVAKLSQQTRNARRLHLFLCFNTFLSHILRFLTQQTMAHCDGHLLQVTCSE